MVKDNFEKKSVSRSILAKFQKTLSIMTKKWLTLVGKHNFDKKSVSRSIFVKYQKPLALFTKYWLT